MIRIRLRTRLMIGIAALLLLGASCADGGNDTSAGPTTASPTATDPTGPTGETEGGGYLGGGGGGGDDSDDEGSGDDDGSGDDGGDDGSGDDKGATAATVTTNNFSFDPGEFEIAGGSEITVKNGNANTPHTFTVSGTDVNVEVGPLESEDALIDLKPGTYDFFCSFHRAQNMVGTLTVT